MCFGISVFRLIFNGRCFTLSLPLCSPPLTPCYLFCGSTLLPEDAPGLGFELFLVVFRAPAQVRSLSRRVCSLGLSSALPCLSRSSGRPSLETGDLTSDAGQAVTFFQVSSLRRDTSSPAQPETVGLPVLSAHLWTQNPVGPGSSTQPTCSRQPQSAKAFMLFLSKIDLDRIALWFILAMCLEERGRSKLDLTTPAGSQFCCLFRI